MEKFCLTNEATIADFRYAFAQKYTYLYFRVENNKPDFKNLLSSFDGYQANAEVSFAGNQTVEQFEKTAEKLIGAAIQLYIEIEKNKKFKYIVCAKEFPGKTLDELEAMAKNMDAASQLDYMKQQAESIENSKSKKNDAKISQSQNEFTEEQYDKQLDKLIEMALIDGELTEKEKKVLFKKAESFGIDLDEFEMVLDAKLFEKKGNLTSNPSLSIQNDVVQNKPETNIDGKLWTWDRTYLDNYTKYTFDMNKLCIQLDEMISLDIKHHPTIGCINDIMGMSKNSDCVGDGTFGIDLYELFKKYKPDYDMPVENFDRSLVDSETIRQIDKDVSDLDKLRFQNYLAGDAGEKRFPFLKEFYERASKIMIQKYATSKQLPDGTLFIDPKFIETADKHYSDLSLFDFHVLRSEEDRIRFRKYLSKLVEQTKNGDLNDLNDEFGVMYNEFIRDSCDRLRKESEENEEAVLILITLSVTPK